MKIEKQLCALIPHEELYKLSIMTFNFSEVKESSKRMTYIRNNAVSKFYNSKNIRTGSFYKFTSLLIDPTAYEAFFGK